MDELISALEAFVKRFEDGCPAHDFCCAHEYSDSETLIENAKTALEKAKGGQRQ